MGPLPLSFVVLALLPIAVGTAAETVPAAPPPAAQVELQMGLCAPADEVVRALALKPDGGPTDVWFFDDPSLSLFTQGVRFRLRIKGARGELTLKVANQNCSSIAPGLVPKGAGKCEYDRHGDSTTGAVSLSQLLDREQIRRLTEGTRTLAQVLSATQIRYLRDALRLWPLPADVRAIGPVELVRYRATGKPYDIDIWTVPSGGRDIEISRKVSMANADYAYQTMQQDLARAQVAICADQSARTEHRMRALVAPK